MNLLFIMYKLYLYIRGHKSVRVAVNVYGIKDCCILIHPSLHNATRGGDECRSLPMLFPSGFGCGSPLPQASLGCRMYVCMDGECKSSVRAARPAVPNNFPYFPKGAMS